MAASNVAYAKHGARLVRQRLSIKRLLRKGPGPMKSLNVCADIAPIACVLMLIAGLTSVGVSPVLAEDSEAAKVAQAEVTHSPGRMLRVLPPVNVRAFAIGRSASYFRPLT